jgi:hypothetical protein
MANTNMFSSGTNPANPGNTGNADPMLKPIVDGFSYSLSRIPAAESYYQNCVANLDMLRRANGYRARWYNVPDDIDSPIPAFGQLEYQVRSQPGAYLWAIMFALTAAGGGEKDSAKATDLFVQITDACTETPILSDYARASVYAENLAGTGTNRPPCLLSQPYLLGDPALVNVEIYNKASTTRLCQLVLLFAEPELPPNELADELQRAGFTVGV